MSANIQITIPVPSTKQVQQAAGHFMRRASERKPQRRAAKLLTIKAMAGRPGFMHAALSIQIFYRDNRGRDTMNTIAALKAAVDGMVEAGAVRDDRWQFMTLEKPIVGIDKKNPRVILTLTQIPSPLESAMSNDRITDQADRAAHETDLHTDRSLARAMPTADASAKTWAKVEAAEREAERLKDPAALPTGKTCESCMHFKRCAGLFGCAPTATTCDFSPSRFRLAPWGAAK